MACFKPEEIILREFEHVTEQQRMKKFNEEKNEKDFFAQAEKYLDYLKKEQEHREHAFDEFEKLFLVAAFIERGRES